MKNNFGNLKLEKILEEINQVQPNICFKEEMTYNFSQNHFFEVFSYIYDNILNLILKNVNHTTKQFKDTFISTVTFKQLKQDKSKNSSKIYLSNSKEGKIILKIRHFLNLNCKNYNEKTQFLQNCWDDFRVFSIDKSQKGIVGNTFLEKFLERNVFFFVFMRYSGCSLEFLFNFIILNKKIRKEARIEFVVFILEGLVKLIHNCNINKFYLSDTLKRNLGVGISLSNNSIDLNILDEEMIKIEPKDKLRARKLLLFYDEISMDISKPFIIKLEDYLKKQRNDLFDSIIGTTELKRRERNNNKHLSRISKSIYRDRDSNFMHEEEMKIYFQEDTTIEKVDEKTKKVSLKRRRIEEKSNQNRDFNIDTKKMKKEIKL